VFVREEVEVPVPPALACARIIEAVHDPALFVVAAQTALAGKLRRGQPEGSRDEAPEVTVRAYVFVQEQTTVVAMRVFTASDGEAHQPTFDVNLEVAPASEEATSLILAGSIRPYHPSTVELASAGISDDLGAASQRFLNQLAALATTGTLTSTDPQQQAAAPVLAEPGATTSTTTPIPSAPPVGSQQPAAGLLQHRDHVAQAGQGNRGRP
jgi:hypothetical protein